MSQFRIMPTIQMLPTCKDFCRKFEVGKDDLILTNPSYFEGFFDIYAKDSKIIYLKKYGKGEPTDIMVEALCKDVEDLDFKRVIAIGGGSIIDVAKLLIQEKTLPLEDLFDKKIPTKKVKEFIVIPTTCGTGSEVTSVSVVDLTCKGTKLGLQTDEEFADYAVLIPELLENLPFHFFATSSIDAFIHAVESYLSPKATCFSEIFSENAIRLILNGYIAIAKNGEEERKKYLNDFLLASTYAGIAFGNAGCAAVHAMSMPFSGAYHVPHGEANYVIFTGVFKAYNRLAPNGKIKKLNDMLRSILQCSEEEIYDELEKLLSTILVKKSMHEYGVKKSELALYTDIVLTKQGRLTANNYTELDQEEILAIYEALF